MSDNLYYRDGHADPTASAALSAVFREEREARRRAKSSQIISERPLVYICSPLAGDVTRNQEMARKYCRIAVDHGAIPVAPHIFFTQFMDDGIASERKMAMIMGLVLQSKCAELWVFGERISAGMRKEIEQAKCWGQPIRWFTVEREEVWEHNQAYGNSSRTGVMKKLTPSSRTISSHPETRL